MQKNCEFFAYVISRIRNTNRPKKKLDNVFQSNCSSHAELPTNLRKIEKRPKIRHKAVMHPALHIISTDDRVSLETNLLNQMTKSDKRAYSKRLLVLFLLEIFLAVWWWKGILKPGNLQITSIPQRSEACFAFRLINSAFFQRSRWQFTVEGLSEPGESLWLPLVQKRPYQSKNGTNVSCGSFAKACGGGSL